MEAYLVYKLIENTGMIDSLESITFQNFIQIDLQDLDNLIAKYMTKNKINGSIKLVSKCRDDSINSIVEFFHQYHSRWDNLDNIFNKIASLSNLRFPDRSNNYDKWLKLSDDI